MVKRVTAVVLAAGESRRMGTHKLLLPWGEGTVLEHTLGQLRQSEVDHCLVISGHRAEEVVTIAAACRVNAVHNPAYAEGEMLSSLQVGLCHLPSESDAVLVVLADQPLVGPEVINHILDAYTAGQGEIVAPAYRGVRGNPVLIDRRYFAELLALPWGEAPRTLLRRYRNQVHLVPVSSPAILLDLDRPEEYERYRPAVRK